MRIRLPFAIAARARTLVVASSSALVFTCRIAPAATPPSSTVYFAHADARYLNPDQHSGGAALVPDGSADHPLPLIVFLHGTNPNGDLHLWLGGGGRDLRPVARRLYGNKKVQPFILAGPSQTRAASHGRKLWQGFELDAFVNDVARALDGQATVDRQSVVFVGHSGAGCSVRGGLASDFWSRGQVLPRALVAVDPCLDEELGTALGRRPAGVPLWVMWQSAVWPRDPSAFKHALAKEQPFGREDRMERLPTFGADAHDAILPLALERAAKALFAVHEHHSDAS